jgi:tellurite resistance protein TehA-like permease
MGGFWSCKHTWKRSANNTKWCLIGCSIGDFGTIALMQDSGYSVFFIFALAMFNGIVTSIILETIILMRQSIALKLAFKTAVGMSLISMLSMEVAMNLVDYIITGGAIFMWWVLPIALFFGFITPWPYNYWRLKKFDKACH